MRLRPGKLVFIPLLLAALAVSVYAAINQFDILQVNAVRFMTANNPTAKFVSVTAPAGMVANLALTLPTAGTRLASLTGAVVNTHAACFDANGVLIDCGVTPGSGTVTSVSVVTANGVSGSVATATTTPAITITLGAITPTTVNGLTITATTGTITLAAGKTLTVSNTLTFTGTDGSSVAFGTGGTVAFTSNNLSVFAATTSAQLAGVISDETGGAGVLVFNAGPTFTGQVLFASGSAGGNPSISFSAQGDMGFYRKSAGVLVYTIGGSDEATFAANNGLYLHSSLHPNLAWTPDGTVASASAGLKFVAAKVVAATDGSTANNGWFTDAGAVRVSTQFDKTTDTTVANIPGLTVNVIAGRSYQFRAILHVTADAVGGYKLSIAGTATATNVIYQINAVRDDTNVFTINSRATNLATSTGASGGTTVWVEITGEITVNAAGTLTVQFAQVAANGTSSVLVGSTFWARDTP